MSAGHTETDLRARNRRNVMLALAHVALVAGILLAFVLTHTH